MAENVDNTLLLEILKEIRAELRSHHTLLLQSVDHGRRLEKHVDGRLLAIDRRVSGLDERIVGLKDDLELMLKSELMGSLSHFETRIENLLHTRLAEKAD